MEVSVLISSRIHLFAEGVQKLLEPLRGIRPVGTANSREELIAAGDDAADVVLADEAMGRIILNEMRTAPRLLLLHDRPSPPPDFGDLHDLVPRGFAGVLDASSDTTLLAKAIRTVVAGELWLDHKTMHDSLCSPPSPRNEVLLTHRERSVLECVCAGLSNKEIADALFISEQTVKSHCNRLFKKFGVHSRLRLLLAVGQDRSAPPKQQGPSL